METLKFKVGDRVRVKSLEWYNENKKEDGRVLNEDASRFLLKEMSRFCGRTLQIKSIIEDDGYIMCENNFFWQDWMLEDDVITEEPVAEEKQEVEQLNKKDMETKLMTKEEVFEYLNDTKILCTSKEESKKVQEKLFALGFSYYGEKSKEVVDCAFTLYINIYKKMQFGTDLSMWVEDGARRIEPSEILAITLKEEKPKFDPKTLRAFDKVLVRDCNTEKWRARSFDMYEEHEDGDYGNYGTTCNCFWIYCIPYNEETEHLHGTNNDEPEFYQTWKK